MNSKRKVGSLPSKTEIRKIIHNQHDRIVLSAAIAFALNLSYALYHCVLGILNLSFWFLAMFAFYGILAAMRFSAVLCGRSKQHKQVADTEYSVMKLSGILLVLLSFVLAVVIYISLSQNIAAKYGNIIMITIAAYTFYKIAMAIVKAVKQHKNPSSLLAVIRMISYAEVAASILTLQRSMLASFDATEAEYKQTMNVITGAVVCLFVLTLGIFMIIKGIKKDDNVCQNPSL